MIELLIIADDFTGAIDTGVQFAKKGAVTRVSTDMDYDFTSAPEDVRVVVLNAETRHLPWKEAYGKIYSITRRAIKSGVRYIYKKTDSGLRGNIGAELSAALAASGQSALYFAPAFPRTGRTTRDGIQYVDGVPLVDSVFGKDLYEPVSHSYIPDMIAEQSGVPVVCVPAGAQAVMGHAPGIYLFDAWEKDHLKAVVKNLPETGVTVMAGCAGFAECISEQFHFESSAPVQASPKRGLVIVSGSVNPVTLAQLSHAVDSGFAGLTLKPEEKFNVDSHLPDLLNRVNAICEKSNRVTIQTALSDADTEAADNYAWNGHIPRDEWRVIISESIGRISCELLKAHGDYVFAFIGGDTLMSVVEKLSISEITPLDEILPGVVLTAFIWDGQPLYVVTKSGGFGREDALTHVYNYLIDRNYILADVHDAAPEEIEDGSVSPRQDGNVPEFDFSDIMPPDSDSLV